MSRDLETIRLEQRAELAKVDLLDRPWLILGGAPEPHVPLELRRSHARVDINNSGLTAKRRGWGSADLTVRRPVESWEAFPDLQTHAMLWCTDRPSWRIRWKLMRQRKAKIGHVIRLTTTDREAINVAICGDEMVSTGELGKPSSGIAALCYALFCGVPKVVLAGFSFARAGHSYDTLDRPRMQIEEDRFALSRLRDDPRLATSEPELVSDLGLRLWQPATARPDP